jgi:hypothetical protein
MVNHQYFLKAKEIFQEWAKGILLREIALWIKILLVEAGMFHVPSVDMAA